MTIEAIVKHLPGWKIKPVSYPWCTQVADDEGHVLTLREVKGRWDVGGSWPDNLYPDSSKHITIDANKPPEKVAADIQRRFLPWYFETWAKQKEKADKTANYKKATEATRQKLIDLGLEASTHSFTLYGPKGLMIDVQGPDSIRLYCQTNFTLKQIKAILKGI